MRGMILALAVALLVAGCGGGGSKGGSVAGMPSGGGETPTTPTATRGNPGAVSLANLSPVDSSGGVTQVGLAFRIDPSRFDRSTLTAHERRSDGITVLAGNTNDGVSSTRLGLYQHQVQNPSYQDTGSGDRPMLRFRVRPTWRHYVDLNNRELYSERIVEFAFDAVRLVNEALPANRKIRVVRDDTMPIGDPEALVDWLSDPAREGTLLAFRFDRATWNALVGPNLLGLAYPLPSPSGTYMHAGIIFVPEGIDSTPGGSTTAVHEILHVLGFRGHVSRLNFPDSALKPHAGLTDPVRIMSREDLAALQYLYGSYGNWNSTRQHLIGATADDNMLFGVTWDNAHYYPWASGRTPSGNLPDSVGRSGTATWDGAMLGYSANRRVIGDVDLTVDLSRVYSGQHDLSFDDIRYWDGVDPDPDAPLWRGAGEPVAGELAYKVRIGGTVFDNADRGFTGRGIPNTSGGAVTGSFYGRTYQSMGGTVQRTDLTAAFGGSR